MKPHKHHSFLLLMALLVSTSCAFLSGAKPLTSKKVIRDGREMLYGKITLEQLFFDYPQWKTVYEEYQPQQNILQKLKQLKPAKTRVLIFLGTWCPDSKREVPRFFKILDRAGLRSVLQVEMWAVDRKKQLPNQLAQTYQIEYVPTFVFERNHQELGRIVESPESMYLEQDVLTILSGK